MSSEDFVPGASPAVGPTGSSAPNQAIEIAGVDNTGTLRAVSVDSAGVVNTNVPAGAATAANQVLQIAQETAAANSVASLDSKTVHVDTGAVVIASSALPTGAATAAKQDVGNTSLSNIETSVSDIDTKVTSIDGKTPSLGQALAGASVPVVLPTAQIALLQAPVLQTGANVIGALSPNQSVNVAQINGVTPDMNTGNAGTGTQRVVLATNQPAIPTTSGANPSGSYAEITNLTTAAQTFTAPANAVGFILEALSDNTNNLRWKQGATATTTSGMRLEPGRDSNYIPCAANISVIAEAGSSQVVSVQWTLSV